MTKDVTKKYVIPYRTLIRRACRKPIPRILVSGYKYQIPDPFVSFSRACVDQTDRLL